MYEPCQTLLLRELIQNECGVVVSERREAALQLLDQARKYLSLQVGDMGIQKDRGSMGGRECWSC